MDIPKCPNCDAAFHLEHLEPGELYTVIVPDNCGPGEARRLIAVLEERVARVSADKCPVFIVVHNGFDIARVPPLPIDT